MRVLGIDFGRRRIGLALSDATGLLARPWKAIAAPGGAGKCATALAAEIERLRAEDDGLDAVVVGLPRRLNGEANEQTVAVEALARSLRARVTIPIVMQDERLSSHEAETLLSHRVKDWRQRKPLLDAAAAAVILQDYLDTAKAAETARREESER